MPFPKPRSFALIAIGLLAGPGVVPAGDCPQWGRHNSRNMVSDEVGLPTTFDAETGRNVRWVVPLGTRSYSTPVIARGRVLVGTNNGRPRDPRHQGDRGVLLCLRESDGALLWQLVVPKIGISMEDCAYIGLTASATVEGDRAYVVTNRGEVLCLDLAGLANGNDGPFREEGQFMAGIGKKAMEVGKTDADILWRFDPRSKLGVRQHDAANCSVLVQGPYVYACTSNGVGHTHRELPAPEAPSLIVLEKATGRYVARDDGRIGPQIIHCMWSSPSYGVVGGRPLVFFGGGDALCYAYDAVRQSPPAGKTMTLKTAWRFHCDPAGRKDVPLDYQDNREEGPSVITGMPVYDAGRVYVTVGGDVWHGRREAWLKCIDATKAGDVTKTAGVWTVPLKRHCMSTPAVQDGLVYICDCGGMVHCVDARTGKACWTHATRGEMWSSPLAADGKVYVGTMRGHFWVFAAGREKKVLHTTRLGSGISATAAAANGVLYVTTMRELYALKETANRAPGHGVHGSGTEPGMQRSQDAASTDG